MLRIHDMQTDSHDPVEFVNVPIEPLEERYSADWYYWFDAALQQSGLSYMTIMPAQRLSMQIKSGEFLDVLDTNHFKSLQMASIVKAIHEGLVSNRTTIFFHDLWFPGLESLFYIRDALGLQFRISGMLHAGSYDTHDFLYHKGMDRWAKGIEQSWFSEVDRIIVASDFHRYLIPSRNRITGASKLRVCPWPVSIPEEPRCWDDKQDIVVFPHRLAHEKRPDLFRSVAGKLRKDFPHWSFVLTKEVCETKRDYYAVLSSARVCVSCAEQETFGIAQMEALLSGCIPIQPNSLSYTEMYPEELCYTPGHSDELEELLRRILTDAQYPDSQYHILTQRTLDKWRPRVDAKTATETIIREAL